MAANTLPIKIGTASANAAHSADLGRTFVIDGIMYRIVKAGATIATAAKKVVVDALTAGQSTHSVDVTTSAGTYLVAGVIPAGQTGSTGTTSLISGDYFPLIVCGKNVAAITDSTTLVAGDPVGTSTEGGKVQIFAASTASIQGGLMGYATLASTAASTTIYVRINKVL
jgi:hypothetical protein